jgi:hypothetical protein
MYCVLVEGTYVVPGGQPYAGLIGVQLPLGASQHAPQGEGIETHGARAGRNEPAGHAHSLVTKHAPEERSQQAVVQIRQVAQLNRPSQSAGRLRTHSPEDG